MVSKKNAKGEDSEDEQTRLFGFRTAYIFDVADTEGEELAQFATISGDPQHYTERLKEFILTLFPMQYRVGGTFAPSVVDAYMRECLALPEGN